MIQIYMFNHLLRFLNVQFSCRNIQRPVEQEHGLRFVLCCGFLCAEGTVSTSSQGYLQTKCVT